MSKTVPTNNAMQFHCTEIKPVSDKYTQNKQLFRYFVGIDSLHAFKSSTLNYEVKLKVTPFRISLFAGTVLDIHS